MDPAWIQRATSWIQRATYRFLEGFCGYLQCDAYSGFDQLYASAKVIEAGCMAHCRRYWHEAIETDSRRAHEAMSYIARLYELERQFDSLELTGNARRDARQCHAVPILKSFETWLDQEHTRVLPKSPIGQAFTYTRNQWQALCRYTEDDALDIDNNIAERLMRVPAIARKNWLFVGSEQGGRRAAMLLSLLASAKFSQVDPWAWLNAVLKELPLRLAREDLPDRPISESSAADLVSCPDSSLIPNGARPQLLDLSDLLPDAWLASHPQHRWEIDALRQEERERSRKQKTLTRIQHTQGR